MTGTGRTGEFAGSAGEFARDPSAAGPFHLLIAALGFADGDYGVHMMAVDTVGNIIHAIEGSIVVGGGGFATITGLAHRHATGTPFDSADSSAA